MVLTSAVLGLLVGLDSSTVAAATVKRVACQLPFVQGALNFFCSDLHQIFFFTQGYDPNLATIRSELLAMDEQGNVLSSIPVHAGDLAKLTSNTNPKALKVTQTNNLFTVVAPIPVLHVTADDGITKSEAFCSNIPFIQTLQPEDAVVSVSNSAADVTHVLAAIPLTDPSHLVITVDGVDLFGQVGIANAAVCTRVSPCSGDLVNKVKNACGGGTLPDVKISNLVVDSGAINIYAANTVSFDVTGLGAGGHQFIIKSLARPGARPKLISASCHDDPLDAVTNSSGFGITVEKPGDQEPGLSFPVEVKGQICSGNPIAVLSINGDNTFDITTQTCTKGNPSDPKACTPDSTSADTWTFNFDFALPKTDVAQDVRLGTAPLGTFDPGSNRLIVGATDDAGNRTFVTRFFGTQTTLNTGVDLPASVLHALRGTVQKLAPTTVDVPNAFAIGLSPAAIRQQIDQKCTKRTFPTNSCAPNAPSFTGDVGEVFHDKVFCALAPNGFPAIVAIPIDPNDPSKGTTTTFTVSPDCSLSVQTHAWITGIDLDPTDISCPLDFDDPHVIHATVNLPKITLHLEVGKDGVGGASVNEVDACVCVPFTDDCTCTCVEGTTLHATTSATLKDMNFKFDITEAQLCNGDPNCTAATPSPLACPAPGELKNGGCFNPGTATKDDIKAQLKDNTDKDGSGFCGISVVCELAAIGINYIADNIFGADLKLGGFDFTLDPDFTTVVGANQPDPIGLNKMGVDNEEVQNRRQKLSGKLTSVLITRGGLLAGLKGSFSSTAVDLTIDPTPGALITQPPLPTMPVPGAADAFILLSTDTLNMLNAGMTVAGALQTKCNPEKNPDDSLKTVGDLLPHAPTGCDVGTPGCNVACDTLAECDPSTDPQCKPCDPTDTKCQSVLAIAEGVCHGINLAACESLTASNPDAKTAALLTAIKQGACHGTKGNNCNSIPTSSNRIDRFAEQEACKKTPNLNVNKNQPLLVCTRQDIPPILLPLGTAPPSPVDSALRLKALSVALVLDRDSLGELGTSLADTPQCGPKAPRTGQCAIFESCLDVNATFSMKYVPPEEQETCGGKPNIKGEPGIKMIFDHVEGKQFPGVLCRTETIGTKDENITDRSAKSKAVDQDLPTAAQAAAPPICMKGFDLNKFVKCDEQNTQLLTVETNGEATSKDWLGVTCKITQ